MTGYLALVLHAHLPYVRHPEYEDALEENWLFEAITETYIPLFLVLEGLLEDGIDFRITLSMTPTLTSMLLDPLLQVRYLKKLERTIELAEKEVNRTAALAEFQPLALLYQKMFLRVHDAFVNRYQKNLMRAVERFHQTGKLEAITSAATHGYLPLLSVNPSAVRAQIRLGMQHYQHIFGRRSKGFWLPECGYYPGLDDLLREEGIRYTILETHGLTRADRRPRYGVHAPLACPSGVAAFGRDPDSSRQVWSSAVGYPGDYDYREFYRDIGYDLPLDYIGPYIHRDGIRIDTGIKYYRITGKDCPKQPYVPEWAERKAAGHADHFLSERINQVRHLAASMDRKPIIVAPYDAELFGHWWFEGPRWLDYLIRRIALDQADIRLVTLSEYLDEYPVNQVAMPSQSSWGRSGFNEVWLNGENDWIYTHLHEGADLVERLSASSQRPHGPALRAANQAARELLLAQSSDWAFMITSGTMQEYGRRRTKSHILRLHKLGTQIDSGSIDEVWLQHLEHQDNLFSDMPVIDAFSTPAVPAPKNQTVALLRYPPQAASVPSVFDVVMASPEAVPFAKTGGLADVVTSLAGALRELGHRVRLIMPAYRSALEKGVERNTSIPLRVPMGGRSEEAVLLTTVIADDLPVHFIGADRYFDRPSLYGGPEGDFPDNAERFTFFARGVLAAMCHLGAPHILHAHDWQAALAVAFLKAQPELYPALSSVRTVLTVHNLGYQGLFSSQNWGLLGLDEGLFTPRHLEFYGQINFLKGGLAFADAISTVSPTYSREIQTSEHGFGLDGFLRARATSLTGILNGVDYRTWNPQIDRLIPNNYGPEDLSGKRACKAVLQRIFGFTQDPDIPLLGVVSRLVSQKGLDLLAAILDDLIRRGVQLVVLGAGDRQYQDFFAAAALQNPERIGVRIGFDDQLAHQIEAGCDIFLMPSLYEPSGLNQLYSLKYGTIPIVRATGGLRDSVEEFNPATAKGNGFVFEGYEASSLLAAIDRALALFRKDQWRLVMKAAMAADHSWNHAAREYVKLYSSLLLC